MRGKAGVVYEQDLVQMGRELPVRICPRFDAHESVYCAHALSLHGSPEEFQELTTIRRRLLKHRVVNPAKYEDHPEKHRDTIGFCLRLVECSDVVVFSRLLDKITAGVGKEVNHALKIGKPVFELKTGELVQHTCSVKYISRTATINLYRKWRAI